MLGFITEAALREDLFKLGEDIGILAIYAGCFKKLLAETFLISQSHLIFWNLYKKLRFD